MTRTGLRAAFREAGALLLPVACAGCEEQGAALCSGCAAELSAEPSWQRLDGGLEVVSGLRYEGVAAAALRALKERGMTGLAGHLAPALRTALEEGVRRAGEEVSAVPVPVSAAAARRRGYRVVELLMRRAGAHPDRALRWTRAPGDQRALGRSERAENLSGSLVAVRPMRSPVLIVDDVVTTGATLAEAARALSATPLAHPLPPP
jgi:predicted amidophosphoribosyltransferase